MKKLKASLIGLVVAGCLALPLSGWAQDDNSSLPGSCITPNSAGFCLPEGCVNFPPSKDDFCCRGVTVENSVKTDSLLCRSDNGILKTNVDGGVTFKSDRGIDAFILRVSQTCSNTWPNDETKDDVCYFWLDAKTSSKDFDANINVSNFILFKAKNSSDDNYYFMNGEIFSLTESYQIVHASNDNCKTWPVYTVGVGQKSAEELFGSNFQLCGMMPKQKFEDLRTGFFTPAWKLWKDNTYICPRMIAEGSEIKLDYEADPSMDADKCNQVLKLE